MSWFRVDDKLWGHPKWLATPIRARGLWVTAGSWSASQDTDGYVPRHVLGVLGAGAKDAAALVASGLWAVEDDGWRFHKWTEFQPDAASTKARRAAESAAGTEGNHLRWHVARGIRVAECPLCQTRPTKRSGTRSGPDQGAESPPNRPGPSRPVPNPDDSPSSSIVTSVTPEPDVDR